MDYNGRFIMQKAAIEREQSDACIDSAERKQARPKVKAVDWSLLRSSSARLLPKGRKNDGMTIPVSACALLKVWDESIISPRSNFVRLLPTGRKNYHGIIHKNNPHFNRKKFQFEFQNDEVLRLKLYGHLEE